MSADLQALLARVEAASGPDREIDADLTEVFTPEKVAGWVRFGPSWTSKSGAYLREPRPFTASLDASLALAERLGLNIERLMADAVSETYRWVDRIDSYPQRLTLSVLAALLRALIAKGEG